MDEYGLVSSDPPWKWVVEKPAFVAWNHKEEGPSCLGQLSPLNSTSRLTINIGWRPGSNELLIVLHLPVSIRSSRHPRDLFMIIPNESRTNDLDLAFEPLQANGNPHLDNAGLSECNLFHVPFNLSKPCDVVMPQAKRQKSVKGTPKELMLNLMSLSETALFDVYFRFDTYAQIELRRIFAVLDRLKSPLLMLESMYHGRGGGVNLWSHQGLGLVSDEDCTSPKDQTRDAIKAQEECPPPPYLDDASPPAEAASKVIVEVPRSEPRDSSTSSPKNLDTSAVPGTPLDSECWARIRKILDYRSPSRQPPTTQDDRDAPKRAAASSPDMDEADAHRRKQTRLSDSVACGPLLSVPPAPTVMRSDPFAVPLGPDAIIDSEEPSICEPSFDLAEAIAQWLYNAWMILPTAHYDLQDHLVNLGTIKDEIAFSKARVECSTQLAFAAARAQQSKSNGDEATFMTASDAEEEVRQVVQWINGISSGGESRVLHELVDMAASAMAVVDASLSARSEMIKRLILSKARCIAGFIALVS